MLAGRERETEMSQGPNRPPDRGSVRRPDRPAPSPQRIVLTGFMGAGKSTVGRILAARLGWRFLDIDTLITTEQRLTVAEIFARHGEPHFRQLELHAIGKALKEAQAVIALGGGAVESDAVRDLLFPAAEQNPGPNSPGPSVEAEHGLRTSASAPPASFTIFLEAPLNEMLARCKGASHSPVSSVRPLLAAIELPEARLARRLPHYRRAHLTVQTSARTPDAVVGSILAALPLQPPADTAIPAQSSTKAATP